MHVNQNCGELCDFYLNIFSVCGITFSGKMFQEQINVNVYCSGNDEVTTKLQRRNKYLIDTSDSSPSGTVSQTLPRRFSW